MTFGKNRVQYNNFYWSYYRFDRYDVYFNQEGTEIAKYVGKYAYDELLKLESILNHRLEQRLIFIVYNKQSDFKQSNIGLLTGKDISNTGGTTQIKKNKVSLFFQGNHKEFEKQIRAAISEIILNEMLYGIGLTENMSSSAMLNIPDWYFYGVISYLSDDWNIEIDNRVKDGILNKKYKKISKLEGEDAIMAGHSFWRYISNIYGSNIIGDIVYVTRINKSVNAGMIGVSGISLKEISEQWFQYYTNLYSKTKWNSNPVENYIIKSKIKITKICLSPNGKNIAYVKNNMDRYKIWIYNFRTGKNTLVYKNGNKIKQIADYSYPVIQWHPSGNILSFIIEDEGMLKLCHYYIDDDKISMKNLLYFDKVLYFDYSENASKLVFSAVKNGKTDIFIHYLASSTNKQLTNDIADDISPRFIEKSDKIIFSSNRKYDSLDCNTKSQIQDNFDLFVYNLNSNDKVLRKISDTKFCNEINPIEIKKHNYLFLSDNNGIRNIYTAKYDSSISNIDTCIHYRYFLNDNPITKYSSNILAYDVSENNQFQADLKYYNGKYYIKNNIFENNNSEIFTIDNTIYKSNWLKEKENIDNELAKELKFDTILLISNNNSDVNNYIFEKEKFLYNYKYQGIVQDTGLFKRFKFPEIQIYQKTFYANQLVNQVDFNFLNSSYQAFTGGAVYFNPGINGLFKIGINDLFEDYKIVAGFRFSADFKSNEYLISFENLKHKIDKQILYHRQSYKNIASTFISKTKTNELIYISKLPFSQVSSVRGTVSGRIDNSTFLATNIQNLLKKDICKIWFGLKGEYIFDNTISKGINLYNGTRLKLFGEYFKQVNERKSDLFVLGADIRNYIPIHKEMILASRFAASTSLGHNKLIYYLGGVDNWTNFSKNIPSFIPLSEVGIDESEHYAFQTVATNMRGFPQNIRNGNSFALINTEIRWPVIQYFSNYPISSSFWSSLQIVGFFDIGTAWSGLNPYSGENAYDKNIIYNGPIKVILDSQREPIVAGYGAGIHVKVLGYFMRFDWAWGIENGTVYPEVFYFSLNLDF